MPYLVGYVTPQDFGAVADGITDDTVAIQAAITAVGLTGGTVFFPATTASYLLNSSALSVTANEVTLLGAGPECVTLTIGSSFVGATAINITGDSCMVRDLSIHGASPTTTSNPVADAIRVIGARRARINRCTFYYINGWAIQAQATNGSATTNPLGTQIGQIFGNLCAGGIRFLGNTTQTFSVGSTITDVQFYLTGVTTGASANLDGFRIEDATDVLSENSIFYMQGGTGSAYHIKGPSTACFAKNMDASGGGAGTGPVVLIEDSANGSLRNTQIDGGVLQQGTVGMQVNGGATYVVLNQLHIVNNQSHGLVVNGTGSPVFLSNVNFTQNGRGASGSNYDINWASVTSIGSVDNCYFASPITAIGVAGVQQSVNITAAQGVAFTNVFFAGTGATSANWFTNTPGAALVVNSARLNFRTPTNFSDLIASLPSSSGNTIFSGNVNNTDTFDRVRILGDGSYSVGPGATGRDVQLARTGVGVWGFTNPLTSHGFVGTFDGNVVVGGTAALGDNGVGELQLATVTTEPTTNPTGGAVLYMDSAGHLKYRDVNGTVPVITGSLSAITATTTIANTNALSTLQTTTIKANDAIAASVYRVTGYGTYSVTGTPTLTFALYWGTTAGTLIAAIPAVTAASGITNAPFSYDCLISFRSTTSCTAMMRLDVVNVTATNSSVPFVNATGPTTVATTADTAITVGFTWSAASASNTISLIGGTVELVR